MGFALKKVWVIGYQRVMGYGFEIPAYQLGGLKILWVMGEYGLPGVWVKRVSTVTAFQIRIIILVVAFADCSCSIHMPHKPSC
jgi:hypothetical protein